MTYDSSSIHLQKFFSTAKGVQTARRGESGGRGAVRCALGFLRRGGGGVGQWPRQPTCGRRCRRPWQPVDDEEAPAASRQPPGVLQSIQLRRRTDAESFLLLGERPWRRAAVVDAGAGGGRELDAPPRRQAGPSCNDGDPLVGCWCCWRGTCSGPSRSSPNVFNRRSKFQDTRHARLTDVRLRLREPGENPI